MVIRQERSGKIRTYIESLDTHFYQLTKFILKIDDYHNLKA